MKITVNIPFSEVLKAVKQLTPTQKHLMLKELEKLEKKDVSPGKKRAKSDYL